MNKTESEYELKLRAAMQANQIMGYGFECMKFEIGQKAWYTPDFMVWTNNGKLEAHEVKGGFIREAAMVRFKAAAKQYPCVDFQMHQKKKGVWNRKM